MKTYKAKVIDGGDGWLVAEVAGLRAFTGTRGGVVTQGRDLDELAYMVHDAIQTLTDETDFAIHLLLPPKMRLKIRARSATAKKVRRRAA